MTTPEIIDGTVIETPKTREFYIPLKGYKNGQWYSVSVVTDSYEAARQITQQDTFTTPDRTCIVKVTLPV